MGLKVPATQRVHVLWPAKLRVSDPAGQIEQPIKGLGLGADHEKSEGFDVLFTVGPKKPAGQVHVRVVIVTGMPIGALVIVVEVAVVANEFGMITTGGG